MIKLKDLIKESAEWYSIKNLNKSQVMQLMSILIDNDVSYRRNNLEKTIRLNIKNISINDRNRISSFLGEPIIKKNK